MGKWEKRIVILGMVITLALFVRKAKAKDYSFESLKIKDVVDKLKKHESKNYKKRELSQIDNVVVHHSATTSGTPYSYARYHVNERNWPGIGYHFVIQKNGTIYKTNELDVVSFHVSGHNTRSIGICLTGNYDTQTAPEVQLQRCAQLIAQIQLGLPNEVSITAHNQFSSKSCPGDNIDLDYLKSLVDGYAQYTV